MTTRRDLLKAAALGCAGLAVPQLLYPARVRAFEAATGMAAGSRHFEVEAVERITVRVPFRPVPERAMDRELPHWRYAEICQVRLRSGAVGVGETLIYYTWGVTGDEDVARVQGQNAVELLWDDSLGAGLQQALFDAVARTAEVPIHRLLGSQANERTPLSWWNIDMPPEDMAGECQEALRQGYRAYKTKGRPWFDLWEQVAQAARGVPETFKIDMDFNETLLDAARAIPICRDLEQYPQVDVFESPIPQRDVEGNRALCEATRVNVAMHFGSPRPATAVREGVCDGFVIGGGASRVMRSGDFAGEARLPFWLQLVGTGITAAYSLHFGAVLRQAVWPAVNCHQLYTDDLLTEPIQVEEGFAAVPQTPGLGYELDRDAVERFRVEKPAERPDPPRLVETTWPDGRRMYFANTGQVNFVLEPARHGQVPYFERGVTTRLWPDDGTTRWRELWTKARPEPLLVN